MLNLTDTTPAPTETPVFGQETVTPAGSLSSDNVTIVSANDTIAGSIGASDNATSPLTGNISDGRTGVLAAAASSD